MTIKIYDFYEDTELIGSAVTFSQAAELIENWIADTDGECIIECYNEQGKNISELVRIMNPKMTDF